MRQNEKLVRKTGCCVAEGPIVSRLILKYRSPPISPSMEVPACPVVAVVLVVVVVVGTQSSPSPLNFHLHLHLDPAFPPRRGTWFGTTTSYLDLVLDLSPAPTSTELSRLPLSRGQTHIPHQDPSSSTHPPSLTDHNLPGHSTTGTSTHSVPPIPKFTPRTCPGWRPTSAPSPGAISLSPR